MALAEIIKIIHIGKDKMDWKEIYKDRGIVQEKPSKKIIELVPLLKKQGVRRILDNGCGTGRHVKYLLGQGFEVYGADYSMEALRICRESAGDKYPRNLIVSDMAAMPFKDNFFDCVISSQVIQHALKPARERAIAEIKRITDFGGIVFLRTISLNQFGFGLGNLAEENTYVDIPKIPDGKTPHHYFSKSELEGYFRDFKIMSLSHASTPPANEFWDNGLNEWILTARKTENLR